MAKSSSPGPVPENVKSMVGLPPFETNAEEIRNAGLKAIEKGNKIFASIGAQSSSAVTFESTVGALEDLHYAVNLAAQRIHFIQNVSPDEEIRKVAEEVSIQLQDWMIDKSYDPHVYRAVKAYAEKKDPLEGEDKKLLEETIRDYRRLGMDLPLAKQDELKELQKKLAALETQFSTNINEYHDEVLATREELEGLDETFIQNLSKADDGQFKISLQYPEYLPTMEFCKSERLRKELMTKKQNTAREQNLELLQSMIDLRHQIAKKIGYESWNDYVLEERMAKTPTNVEKFLKDLSSRLKKKGEAELKLLEKLKAEVFPDSPSTVHMWDYMFLSSLYKKKHFQVDEQALKEFFPLDRVLSGMFQVYETLFSIKFDEAKSGFYKWHDDVRLFRVSDKGGEVLGFFYLDLYPRLGKYGHAAVFGLIEGKFLPDGMYQRPVAAMVCNFTKQAPQLLSHGEVETLFHEFGHILHHVLTRAKFSEFSGTSVSLDFVEAPSQVLENWVWDYDVLQKVSKHHTNPAQKLSKDLVQKMQAAKLAGMGLFYLRQLSLSVSDIQFHNQVAQKDPVSVMNRVVADLFLPPIDNNAFPAGWGHMVGYASGYYSYAWADVMAADIFSVFEKDGLLNPQTGLRLRKEIYEPGASRDENESLEKFLGRPLSYEAFFRQLGV